MTNKNKLTWEHLKYSSKYTLNTYVDLVLSTPLYATEKFYKLIAQPLEEAITGKREWADWDNAKQFTPGYKKRNAIREKWDTEKGVNMIISSLSGSIVFFLAGSYTAELTYSSLEKIVPQNSHIIRELTTSLATAIAGYAVSNTVIAGDFTLIRDRKNHLKADGSLDWRKIYSTSKSFIKAALSFDIPFFSLKVAAQTTMIANGVDPAPASMMYDTVGLFAWYSYVNHASMRNNVFRPKSMPENFPIHKTGALQ